MNNKFNDLNYQLERFVELVGGLDNEEIVNNAYKFAEKAHAGQKRDEGVAYIIHPVRLVNSLIDELQVEDKLLLVAALLHDVVEDSDCSVKEISSEFGDKVAKYVNLMTRSKDDDGKLGRFQAKLDYLKHLEGVDDGVQLLKAVDQLDLVRSFPFRKDVGSARYYRHIREIDALYLPFVKNVSKYVFDEIHRLRQSLPDPVNVETNDPVEKI